MSSMLSVTDADTHLSRAFGPGCAWRRAGGAAMSPGSRTAGVKSATATISAIFLTPGRVPSSFPAVLRAHRDALAVALHHEHVAGRPVSVRVPGAPGVEVVRPGGEVLGEPGQLGAADRDAGAGLDDLLGLPEPAAGPAGRSSRAASTSNEACSTSRCSSRPSSPITFSRSP